MTREELEKVAGWLGWRPCEWRKGVAVRWRTTSGAIRSGIRKISLTDAEAVEALKRLVRAGYSPCLHWCLGNKWSVELFFDGDFAAGASEPTIHEAVEQTILKLQGG